MRNLRIWVAGAAVAAGLATAAACGGGSSTPNSPTGACTPSTNPNPTKLFYSLALLYSLPVIIQHFASGSPFERKLRRVEPYLYVSMVALMYLEAGPETSFIYFQF